MPSGVDPTTLIRLEIEVRRLTMKLFPLRAELAVMNILSEHRLQPGDVLRFFTLTDSWRRYGLRERDLPQAISRLELLGLIEVQRKRGQRTVLLTQAGATWLRSPRGIVTRLLLLPRYVRVQLSQFLSLTEHPVAGSRRATDQPTRET